MQSVGSVEVVKGNSSSLYTNAPGGIINFISDIHFPKSFFYNFNEFGSFDLRSNGFKTGVKTDKYAFLLTYNYHQAKGYRPHSDDYFHIVNSVLETKPGDLSTLGVYVNYVDGLIKLPGSLKLAEFTEDPYQANQTDVSRDSKRITTKGRVGLRFETFFGENNNNDIEVTGYATMKYFERTSAVYRIFTRNGVGASGRYVNRSQLFGQANEFSVGSDLFYQTGPIEFYPNLNGARGDGLVDDNVVSETIGNTGLYFQNTLNLVKDKLDLMLSGRSDKVVFDSRNAVLAAKDAIRRYEKFTPKAALNYKLTPRIAAYTSYGAGFDTPAFNEMDNYPTSSDFPKLLNPDLQAQKSNNFELGVKGNVFNPDEELFKHVFFEATFFNSKVEDEIVPFEVGGDVFFRNAGKTNRTGIEIGGDAEVVPGLHFKPAYTYSNFKYDSYVARTIDNSGNVIDKDFSGNIVPSVPKHNLSLTLSYLRNLLDNLSCFVKGNYISVTEMYTDDQNSEGTASYQLMNSTVGFDLGLDKFNIVVSGGVNNMTDEVYAAFININSTSGRFYEAGEPRNYFGGIRLGYSF